MTPRLHRRYARDILDANRINPKNERTQHLIERYSPETGLDEGRLAHIQRLVKRYNKFVDKSYDLRYYQILALYFTEHFYKEQAARDVDERHMLAYWMATGSGKTLIMHLNLLQHLDRLERQGTDYDRLEIILTTPGVNLIRQHEEEFAPFVEAVDERYADRLDLTIETTQALLQHDDTYFNLKNNLTQRLVLVDEGHIGLSSTEEGEFKRLRTELNKQNSFLFEYSATYHNLGSPELEQEYERAIIYDYNYAHFYDDGYGKDYFFKRIGEDIVRGEADEVKDNLDECFGVLEAKSAAHRQVLRLPGDEKQKHFPVNLPQRPLIALMGGTVSPRRNQSDEAVLSDVHKVLRYLASLTHEERRRFTRVFHGDVAGPLRLTRNRDVADEILLSYGDGEKWGLINVSSGDRFASDLELPGVEIEKRTDPIIEERYHFQHIDDPGSPINVLIGSRKFSEGWNCFRLSVIGLINLGRSKGNQIIQIFGRGVRLHGGHGEGKRTFEDHLEDYFTLGESTEDHIRRLETLTVFSLKSSYLRTFIDQLKDDVPPRRTFTLQVRPRCIKLGDGTTIEFEKYRKRLPIFKMRDRETGMKRVVLSGNGAFNYELLTEGGVPEDGKQKHFRIRLDYRTDRDTEGKEVVNDLRNRHEALHPFVDHVGHAKLIRDEADEAGLSMYSEKGPEERLRPVLFEDLLSLVENIRYGRKLNVATVDEVDALARHVIKDVVRRVKNRINYLINRQNYIYHESPEQSMPDEPRDFLYEYVVTKEFNSQEALEAFEEALDEKRDEIRTLLSLAHLGPHIYTPLLNEEKKESGLTVSPDLLNPGERKFVRDLADYTHQHFADQERYEFYLLRNVESLRSIGIWLEDDEGAFFPDFVLWIVDSAEDKIYVVLVDPKGQRGLNNPNTRENSEKVKIARKSADHPALLELEERLNAARPEQVILHSFILLRDKSPFGRTRGAEFARQELLPHNLLRLDWHQQKENGSTSQLFENEKSYLDLMFEKVGVSLEVTAP